MAKEKKQKRQPGVFSVKGRKGVSYGIDYIHPQTLQRVRKILKGPLLDPDGSLWTSPFVLPDRWVLESNAGDTGGAYRWLVELLLGATDAAAFGAAEAMVTQLPLEPASPVCHLGPVVFGLKDMNPFHLAGLLFRFPLLDLDRPRRPAVLRGFLDSVAYAVRGNLAQIEAVAGRAPSVIRLSGGMTRIAVLPALVATVLGRPVEVCVGSGDGEPRLRHHHRRGTWTACDRRGRRGGDGEGARVPARPGAARALRRGL